MMPAERPVHAGPAKSPRLRDGPQKSAGVAGTILWILLIALAVRALALLRTDPVAFDGGIYFEMAQFIRAGNWAGALGYDFPPLYPALIAGVQFLGVGAVAGLGIALAADLLVLLPLAGIARAGVRPTWGYSRQSQGNPGALTPSIGTWRAVYPLRSMPKNR